MRTSRPCPSTVSQPSDAAAAPWTGSGPTHPATSAMTDGVHWRGPALVALLLVPLLGCSSAAPIVARPASETGPTAVAPPWPAGRVRLLSVNRESETFPYAVELRWELLREDDAYQLDTSPTFPSGVRANTLEHRVEERTRTRLLVNTRLTEDRIRGGSAATLVGLHVAAWRSGAYGHLGEWRVPTRLIAFMGGEVITPTYDGSLEIEAVALPALDENEAGRWILREGLEYPFVFLVHNHTDARRRVGFGHGAPELGVPVRKRWVEIEPRTSERFEVTIRPERPGSCDDCVIFSAQAPGEERPVDELRQGAEVR